MKKIERVVDLVYINAKKYKLLIKRTKNTKKSKKNCFVYIKKS